MAGKGSTNPAFVWNWVIEALATSEQADASSLIGLVNTAPGISGDAGKDARELVSFRVLENLFAHGNDTDADSAQNAKISFDASERCEDVLNKILQKTPEPMLKQEQEKWDVRPFLMHKRSSMPICLLIKLKEAMLGGSNPLLSSLKEKSKLVFSNVSEDTSLAKDDPSLNFSIDKNKVQENVLPETDQVQSSVGGTTEHAGIEDDTSLTKDDLVLNDPIKETNTVQEEVSHGADQEEKLSAGTTEYAGLENCEMFTERPLEGPGGNQMIKEGADANILCDGDHLPGDTYTEGHCKRVSVDSMESLEFVVTIQQNSERDNDERTDFAAEKEAFLKSQCTTSQDSLAMTEWSEIDLCMKCNAGGQLLVCSSDACVIRVHESCLGSSVTLDESGKFFCPFCAYSRAISKCLEAKRKVSLARKDLQAFTSFSVNHMLHKSSEKQSELQKLGTESFPETTEGNANGHTASRANDINCKSNEQDFTSFSVNHMLHKSSEKQSELQKPGTESFPETTEGNGNGHTASRANDVNCKSNEQDSVLHDPLMPIVNDEMHGDSHTVSRANDINCKSNEPDCVLHDPLMPILSDEIHGDDHTASRANDINCKSNEQDSVLHNPLIPKVNDEMHIETECLNQQTTGLPQTPIPEPGTPTKKCKRKETQSATEPSSSRKLRKRKAQHTPPVPLPSIRRNKLSWTKTEEEILEEGVQRYASASNKGIPWKEILDFGRNVFHKGRTTIDLKDKWRNMCKGNTNVK